MKSHVDSLSAPLPRQVLLRGGDLLVLHSQARHDWAHGIAAVASEVYSGDMPPLVALGTTAGIAADTHNAQQSAEEPSGGAGAGTAAQVPPPAAGAQAEPGAGDSACIGGSAASGGLLVARGTRLSVTLRRLKSGIVLTEQG
jgi:hypothetical protein